MKPFVYNAYPARVLFGSGTISQLPAELERQGARKAMILATPEQRSDAEALADQLGAAAAGVFAQARMHTPLVITEEALRSVSSAQADCLVSLGGGSTIGLGKAIAVRTGLPQIAIPTTYAGSEATPILGETADGVKTTRSLPTILPEVILYDVDLTLTLPAALTLTSGINAIAHAVEGLYSEQSNPIISLVAEEGIRALAGALPRIAASASDATARSDALYGAWLCGTTLGAVGMALHHKLCHALGGSFDLPHAPTHTVILPHALAYNAPFVPAAIERIRRALGGVADVPGALFELSRSLGGPISLRELGMPQEGLDRVLDLTFAKPYWNPAPLERERLRATLQRAWEGQEPLA